MTCLAFPEFLCPFTERVYNIFHFLSFHFFLFTSFTRPVTLEKSGFFYKQMRLRSCLHRLVNKICKQALKTFLLKWQLCIIRYFYKSAAWLISFPASLWSVCIKSMLWSFTPSFNTVVQNISNLPQFPLF